MSALLEVEGLHVDIQTQAGRLEAVRGLDLSVAPGETLSIVGESGSGKSLTALAIMGLLPPGARRKATRLRFEAQDLGALSRRALEDIRGRRLSMIFQDPSSALNPAYSIGSQLTGVYRRHRGGTAAAARDRAVALLERVGITAAAERLGQFPHQLSGGLKQRVMIAMALMCSPALVLADEPTTALDVTIQAQVLRLLRDLQREMQLAIILVTHDLGVVAAVADRVAVMYAGEIVESGSVQEIFGNPQHPYTQGLFACLPKGRAGRHGERLGTIPGLVPSLISPPAGCAFADRCPLVLNECRRAPVPNFRLSPTHAARCLRVAIPSVGEAAYV
ncbi:MAG: peptide transporter ATP-binding protein [Xanthobacteraceae bacterium]|jgi:peptide/nickel transport system ATP-binding protein|nr:peptide transporter ATP-binding protein [Xanthobacteraceae bacterium]